MRYVWLALVPLLACAKTALWDDPGWSNPVEVIIETSSDGQSWIVAGCQPDGQTLSLTVPDANYYRARAIERGPAATGDCDVANAAAISEYSNVYSELAGLLPYSAVSVAPVLPWSIPDNPEPPVMAQPTIGATVSSQTDSTSPWSSLSHTVDASTDLLIVAVTGWNGNNDYMISGGANPAVSSATWTKSGESGQAMTALNPPTVGSWGFQGAREAAGYFILEAPNIGAGSITFGNGQTPMEGLHFIALNIVGVDTTVGTSGIRDTESNSSQGASTSATVDSSTDDLVLALLYTYIENTITWTSGGTSLYSAISNSAAGNLRSFPGATTSKTISVSATDYPALFVLSIAGATGGSTETVSTGLDAIVQRQQAIAASLDAYLQKPGTESVSLDGLLQKTQSVQASLDAAVQKSLTRTVSLDGLLQSAETLTTALDALLAQQRTASVSFDAYLSQRQTTGVSLDAAVRAARTLTASLDAAIQQQQTGTVSLDGVLAAAQALTASLDAVLQKRGSISASLDAVLLSPSSQTITTSLDANLQKSQTATTSLDGYIQQPGTISTVLDALLRQAKTGTVSLDANLQASQTITTALDAVLLASGEVAVTLALDAVIQATQTESVSLDALLAQPGTATLSLDANLQQARMVSTALDAAVRALQTETASLDALLRQAKTAATSLDGIIGQRGTLAVALDALVQKTLTRTASLDANLRKALTTSLSFDAILVAAGDLIEGYLIVAAAGLEPVVSGVGLEPVVSGVGYEPVIN